MFAKLSKIGELAKVLSVKNETCDAIMHFMSVFWHRQDPFQTLFGQDAWARYGRADTGHDGVPYS